MKVEKAQEIAGAVGQVLAQASGIRSHLVLSAAAHAGQGVEGLKCLRGALLVHAASVADVLDLIDAELCRYTGLDPEPLHVLGAAVSWREERRRRRLAAQP